MAMSMYGASVPLFQKALKSLAHVLARGAGHAGAVGMDHGEMLEARLAPDMFPLVAQVRLASEQAATCVALLAGVEAPAWPDDEATFALLQARLARAQDFLASVTPAQLDGSEERMVHLKLRGGELRLPGERFLIGVAIPNVLFHCTIAYAILRHLGVDLGKRDFLNAV